MITTQLVKYHQEHLLDSFNLLVESRTNPLPYSRFTNNLSRLRDEYIRCRNVSEYFIHPSFLESIDRKHENLMEDKEGKKMRKFYWNFMKGYMTLAVMTTNNPNHDSIRRLESFFSQCLSEFNKQFKNESYYHRKHSDFVERMQTNHERVLDYFTQEVTQ